jgi:Zn-dependent protease
LSEAYEVHPSVEEAVRTLFEVEDHYFDHETPIYIVTPRGRGAPRYIIKEAFKELAERIRPLGYLPLLRWIVGRYYISIIERKPAPPENIRRNVLLFAATICTVFLDGYLRSNNPVLTEVLMKGTPVFVNAALFTLSILAVFGLHELGHKAISKLRGVDTSMPYFIPAPPGMGGTFGALITQREPPVNRDALFDIGLSGPLVGFVATTVIGIIGLNLSFVAPQSEVASWMTTFPGVRFQEIPMPMLLEILTEILKPVPEGMVLLLHPVSFAAWVGCVITFINLIPAWQLDGGHIARALMGRESHKVISIAGVFLLLISGYMIMGVLVAFLMMQGGKESVSPLDDLSPLSWSRKLAILVYFGIMALTLVALLPF